MYEYTNQEENTHLHASFLIRRVEYILLPNMYENVCVYVVAADIGNK